MLKVGSQNTTLCLCFLNWTALSWAQPVCTLCLVRSSPAPQLRSPAAPSSQLLSSPALSFSAPQLPSSQLLSSASPSCPGRRCARGARARATVRAQPHCGPKENKQFQTGRHVKLPGWKRLPSALQRCKVATWLRAAAKYVYIVSPNLFIKYATFFGRGRQVAGRKVGGRIASSLRDWDT